MKTSNLIEILIIKGIEVIMVNQVVTEEEIQKEEKPLTSNAFRLAKKY